MTARGTPVSPDTALEFFVAAEHARLVGLLALYTSDRTLAEELAQDAIVALCRHWPRVRQMANPHAWLSTVALNGARSWYRRQGAERRANRRHDAGQPTATHDVDTAGTLAVRQAVAALPPRQREAIVLRFYARLTVIETATAMQCADGTVKSLTHKAIAALRTVDALLEPAQRCSHE